MPQGGGRCERGGYVGAVFRESGWANVHRCRWMCSCCLAVVGPSCAPRGRSFGALGSLFVCSLSVSTTSGVL